VTGNFHSIKPCETSPIPPSDWSRRWPRQACHLHQLIYRKHPEIRAIVNATPVNATAFSASAARLDTRTILESYIFLRDVAVLPFSWV
jgi:ribulose-5-phosphate 4-epimerase/fuculose-1-phosphate aldolase